MKGYKFLIIISFIACLFTLQAQSSVSVSPLLTYQHFYTEDESTDYSSLGLGAEVAYDHKINDTDYAGLSASYARFSFKDFHAFNELKGTLRTRYLLIPYGKSDASVRLYRTFGIGADYLMRDDGEKTLSLLINGGLQLNISETENRELILKADVALVAKEGVSALDATFGIGYAFSFGGSSKKTVEEKAVTVPVAVAEPATPEPTAVEEPKAEPKVHIHTLSTGFSILEPSGTQRGYKCYICSECGLICEILEPAATK